MGMLLLLFPTVILYVAQVMFDISTHVTKEVTTKVSHIINPVIWPDRYFSAGCLSLVV